MHVDQLKVIIRYVLPSGSVERFIKFIPKFGHTGAEIAEIILNFLDETTYQSVIVEVDHTIILRT